MYATGNANYRQSILKQKAHLFKKKAWWLIKKTKTDTWPGNEVSLPAIWAQLTGDVYEKYSVLNDHEWKRLEVKEVSQEFPLCTCSKQVVIQVQPCLPTKSLLWHDFPLLMHFAFIGYKLVSEIDPWRQLPCYSPAWNLCSNIKTLIIPNVCFEFSTAQTAVNIERRNIHLCCFYPPTF